MKISALICGAIVAAMVPAVALADDPRDPAMRNAAARARDSEATRELNRQENARVVERGVRWGPAREVRRGEVGYDQYAAALDDHERAMAAYRRDRAQYERDMAKWRRAVAACDAGDYAACDN
jgi:hypothetical protein